MLRSACLSKLNQVTPRTSGCNAGHDHMSLIQLRAAGLADVPRLVRQARQLGGGLAAPAGSMSRSTTRPERATFAIASVCSALRGLPVTGHSAMASTIPHGDGRSRSRGGPFEQAILGGEQVLRREEGRVLGAEDAGAVLANECLRRGGDLRMASEEGELVEQAISPYPPIGIRGLLTVAPLAVLLEPLVHVADRES